MLQYLEILLENSSKIQETWKFKTLKKNYKYQQLFDFNISTKAFQVLIYRISKSRHLQNNPGS